MAGKSSAPVSVDDVVFGPKVHEAEVAADEAPAAPSVRLKQTEMRPLAAIQDDLRQQTKERLQGKFRPRRQV